jgi:hypothetical protein
MCCKLIEGLASQYLRALDLVDRAKLRLRNAATQTSAECAATELRRVEEYRQDTLREIAEHCENHGCATGPLAQRLEQRTHNPLVEGSNPSGPTNAYWRTLGLAAPAVVNVTEPKFFAEVETLIQARPRPIGRRTCAGTWFARAHYLVRRSSARISISIRNTCATWTRWNRAGSAA